jgi:hypothetical protein
MIALLLAATIFMQRPGALQPGTGIVTGTIKAANGSAAGIRVGAIDVDDSTASSFLAVAETDAAGKFRLTNIPAGQYYIVAGRLNSLQYFPNGGDRTQAAEVAVEAARVRADVNFTVAAGSARPPQLPRLASNERAVLSQINGERDSARRERLLLEFERQNLQSPVIADAYLSLMNLYVSRSDARKAAEFGEKAIARSPEDVNVLVQVSRAYAILQSDPKKALAYAEKGATLAARLRTAVPGRGENPVEFQRWATSMDTNARANLEWVRKVAVWQQEQFLSLVAPRRR